MVLTFAWLAAVFFELNKKIKVKQYFVASANVSLLLSHVINKFCLPVSVRSYFLVLVQHSRILCHLTVCIFLCFLTMQPQSEHFCKKVLTCDVFDWAFCAKRSSALGKSAIDRSVEEKIPDNKAHFNFRK